MRPSNLHTPRASTVRAEGSMTVAMKAVSTDPRAKALRVGLIRDGKIIEERIILRHASVSIGSSESNDFIVTGAGVPRSHKVFESVNGRYLVRATDSMQGRLAHPGGVQDLADAISGGADIVLDDGSRGRIQIGDSTILFQFVPEPKQQPRPQLPASVQGGLLGQVDWLFTAFAAVSFMIYAGFIVVLEGADWPTGDQISAEQLRDAIPFIIEEPDPPPPNEFADNTPDEAVPDETTPDSTDTPVARNDSATRPNRDGSASETTAEARARIAMEARTSAQTLLLGAFAENGAVADVMRLGHMDRSAADVLATTEGAAPASSQQGVLRPRGGGGGSGQGIDPQGLCNGGNSRGCWRRAGDNAGRQRDEGGELTERPPTGTVSPLPGDDIGGPGFFDQNQVSALIRGRSSALRRCYETALRDDPTLGGRVTVRFTIQERGNVSGASAVANSTGHAGLGSCVVRVISGLRWREGPEGGSVSFQYPFMFAPQN